VHLKTTMVATVAAVAVALSGCGGSGSGDGATSDASTRLLPDHPLSTAELQTTAETERARLTAAGLDDVKVSVDNDALLLSGPRARVDAAVPLAEAQGMVRFRLVEGEVPAAGDSTSGTTASTNSAEVAAAYLDWSCADDGNPTDGTDRADEYILACDETGGMQYMLAPTALDSRHVADASAADDAVQTLTWVVTLRFDDEGSDLWFDLTKRAYEAPETCSSAPDEAGCNQIAVVLDGVVISAPASQQPGIRGGVAQIAGDFTEQRAKRLAAELASGPLPTSFTAG
jgi:preprotein translocase subunit SecD